MDELYFKVFKNIYLFNKIYSFVKNKGIGKQLKDIRLSVIFRDRRLFELYYNSYIYNRGKEENQYFDSINKKFKYLFLTKIITIEEFIEIYNDFSKVFPKRRKRILKICILNNDNGIEFIKYLVSEKSFKFDINHFQEFLGHMCKSKELTSSELLLYVIHCFKNNSYNHNCDHRSVSKQELDKQKSNPFSLHFQTLIDCLESGKTSFYKTIFQLSIDSLTNSKGLEIPFKLPKGFSTTIRNQLLNRIVALGSIEMAQVYIDNYPNIKSPEEEKIHFYPMKDKTLSFQVYLMFVINKTFSPGVHLHFSEHCYLEFSSAKLIKQLDIEGYTMKHTTCTSSIINSGISMVEDLETLKFLYQVKDKFKPKPLKFNSGSLLVNASRNRDLEMFKFLIESPYFKAVPFDDPRFSDTSLEIIKYCIENVQSYTFRDICISCGFDNNLEYVKYIIDKYNSIDNYRCYNIILSYRCIDKVCELNYIQVLKYLLENLKDIKISRDAINYAIKNENFDMVQLLINMVPNKPSDKPTLYESTIESLLCQSFKNNTILLSLFNSSIYKDVLIKGIKNFFVSNSNFKIERYSKILSIIDLGY